jgi:hypothetical protein
MVLVGFSSAVRLEYVRSFWMDDYRKIFGGDIDGTHGIF